jgi:tripartite-type tricarboxylate transporter receptor subunit TctC
LANTTGTIEAGNEACHHCVHELVICRARRARSPQRSPLPADIPTSAEAGSSELPIDSWICIMTTGGTPAPIIARLDGEFAKAFAVPEIRDAFDKPGIEIFYVNSQELKEFSRSEARRFSNLLKHSRVVKPP